MKTKARSIIVFILIVLVIGVVGFVGFKGAIIGDYQIKSFDKTITKGLDLQGGVSVVMEIKQDKVKREDLEKTKEVLALRVNKVGVSETVVAIEGNNKIRIDIPGKYDSKTIVDSLSKTGELKFIGPDQAEILTGKDVAKATPRTNPQSGKPEVGLELTESGKKKFADATTKFVGQNIAIKMDEDVLTNPVVNEPILGGEASISGSKSLQEAKKLAALINGGALPLPVKTASVQTVGAQLGADALPNAMKAGVVGIGIIFLFLILYYRVPGFLACISLSFYIVILLLTFALMGATLTLPGIAGFLLTIGMAADANILIFERTREELRTGKSIKASIESGLHNAMSSIVDSNLTTIIGGIVLYIFGAGPVKGFALTLIMGIVLSLLTAIVFTKLLMKLGTQMGILSKPSLFGVKRRAN
ncbi:preprotein translocase subunit SecD [Clostridium cavendishii DSM 21758]|uniref:Protein translocase subunit SecD n=1 Tax=Clostridium cavendishii DSM 21758 TaxID=1121302 RepID=A0A1M6AB30_9CLOT|nr:protein translocase subunit SecD [Clostridium cavendishii]SHI33656.1 preprotein translocase subunit SecD [Clostridium cavendishii DSM 21758]